MTSSKGDSRDGTLATDASAGEEALVARAKGGDYEAFEELVERHEEKVFRLALRFMRNEAEAQEVTQDALLSAWKHLGDFKGESQFGSWLHRVTANTALMRLRSQGRRRETSTEDVDESTLESLVSEHGARGDWSRRPDELALSAELRRHIQAAVDALPELYREVFLIRDVEGLSTEETGELLGLSVPAVKTRLHRARLALRDAIDAYFEKA